MIKEQELQKEIDKLRGVLAEFANKKNWEVSTDCDDEFDALSIFTWKNYEDPIHLAQDVLFCSHVLVDLNDETMEVVCRGCGIVFTNKKDWINETIRVNNE